MEDYKRLTKRDELHGAVVDIEDVGDGAAKILYDVNGVYYFVGTIVDRLAELEDKIENGTLIPVEQPLTDKSIEFFVKHNAEVRKTTVKEFARQVKENLVVSYKTNDSAEQVVKNLLEAFDKCLDDTSNNFC